MKLLLKGGRVIDPANQIDGIMDVLIAEGKIAAVGQSVEAGDAQVYDVSGKVVTPGWIDMHVHLREPGFEGKETIWTGTRAAAAGGVTAVASMPNTPPVADNQSVIRFIRDKAREAGWAKVYPIGAITKGSLGEELAEIGEMQAAGAVAISDDGKPVSNGQMMRLALEYAGMFDLPVISHAEDLKLANEGYMHEGYISTILGFRGIPSVAEEAMVARDLLLAAMTGSRLHIAHVSTAGAGEMIREAKKRGVKVTAEVTPHHLTLTDEAVQSFDTSTKVNPPLRTEEDRQALIKGLMDGTLDVIATDHAPHAREEKEMEFAYAPFGLVGLETLVPLVVDRVINAGHLTWSEAIAKVTCNPAGILGVPGGNLGVGKAADITVIDPEKTAVVRKESFYSMGKNTPFEGWELKGWPVMTVLDGRVVMQEGRLVE
ncbi:MAG: dihydroorotase [Clostridia bacterium]|nr:dihydroorotase [Clostridia bacterium]